MNIRKTQILAISTLILFALYPQKAHTEGFTSADVLGWSVEDRSSYVRVSVGMAGVIVAQKDRAQAQCIDRWYSVEDEKDYPSVVDAMRRYPNIHPQGVVLWAVQNECGKIIK